MSQAWGLRTKLLVWVVMIVLAGFGITVAVVASQAANQQRASALLYAQELASRQASDIRNQIEDAMTAATVLAAGQR